MLIELCPTGFGQYSIFQLDCSSLIGFCVLRFILGGPLCCFRFFVFCGLFQVDLYAVLGFWCSAVYFRSTFTLFQVFVFCSLFQVECLLLQVFCGLVRLGQIFRLTFQYLFCVPCPFLGRFLCCYSLLCSAVHFKVDSFCCNSICFCELRSFFRLNFLF